MKRKILFRGFNLKNNKWLYGYYFVNRGLHFICPDGMANPLHRGRTSLWRRRVSGSVRESRTRPERTYMRVMSSAAATAVSTAVNGLSSVLFSGRKIGRDSTLRHGDIWIERIITMLSAISTRTRNFWRTRNEWH